MKIIQKTVNEPVRNYKPGSDNRKNLQAKYDQMASELVEIPLIIGSKTIKTQDIGKCIMPHDHQHILGKFHKAGEYEIQLAIDNSLETWKTWT